MPEVSLSEWNQFLKEFPNAHLLQTGEWGELKSGFGWEVLRFIRGKLGAQILFRKLPFGLSMGYLPKPVFSDRVTVFSDNRSGDSDMFWREVDVACRRKRTIFLKIEPDCLAAAAPSSEQTSSDFRLSRQNIQPPRTLVVDLRPAEDELLARMKQKCRYNINLAARKGVAVEVSGDLDRFYELMRITGGRDSFGVHSAYYYRRAYELFHRAGMCEILAARHGDDMLAALMVFKQGRRSWYLYGASDDRERNRMPTYLLQWEAMRWAKAGGCEEYDLWGVPDEEERALEANFEMRSDGLWGVYRFKRGFGGELRRSAQSLDRVYMPLIYPLYLAALAQRVRA
jgi:lipid II:glycine glycyltransferase (peptidoglycan interpeptide bridge formation enzyme)